MSDSLDVVGRFKGSLWCGLLLSFSHTHTLSLCVGRHQKKGTTVQRCTQAQVLAE
jgi:hypothetical protein